MIEHTKTPWAQVDNGVGELVVYCSESGKAICTFDDMDSLWDWPENYFVSGEAEANARHIVHCVNNHERLVEALRNVCDMWKTVCSVSGWDEQHMAQYEKARTLLAEFEKGERV